MLVKYVVVSDFGGNWFDMVNTLDEARLIVGRHSNVHVEKWIYGIDENGHTGPWLKLKLTNG